MTNKLNINLISVIHYINISLLREVQPVKLKTHFVKVLKGF